MKKKTKIIIGILVVFAILVAGISYREYIKAHTFTVPVIDCICSLPESVNVCAFILPLEQVKRLSLKRENGIVLKQAKDLQ